MFDWWYAHKITIIIAFNCYQKLLLLVTQYLDNALSLSLKSGHWQRYG